jgi:hypothetical protein
VPPGTAGLLERVPPGTGRTPGAGVMPHSSRYVPGTAHEKIVNGVRRLYDAAVPEVTVTLSSDPSSVREARHFVVRNLQAWGHDEASWAAAQIVSELAGNCALHARTDFEVRLVEQGSALRLEVRDSSAARVQQRRYSAESTTGRGLRLVDTLCRSWGVDIDDRGKTVWVDLRRAADVSDTGELDDEVDLDALLSAFGDEDAGQQPTRATALVWQVAA